MAIEIVDLPIENCDFPYSYVNVYQRVASMTVMKSGFLQWMYDLKERGLYSYVFSQAG